MGHNNFFEREIQRVFVNIFGFQATTFYFNLVVGRHMHQK